MNPRNNLDCSSARGFSLVEVTIALAIASMGFITLLGLLPQGLDMARRSADMAAEVRIMRKLAGELQSTSWDKINWSGYGPTRYFNDQAVELTAAELADPEAAFTLTYVASVHVPGTPLDLALPSKGTVVRVASGPQSYARRVHIAVTSATRADFDFSKAERGSVKTYPVLIADMGAK